MEYDLIDKEIALCVTSRRTKSRYAESFGLFKGNTE